MGFLFLCRAQAMMIIMSQYQIWIFFIVFFCFVALLLRNTIYLMGDALFLYVFSNGMNWIFLSHLLFKYLLLLWSQNWRYVIDTIILFQNCSHLFLSSYSCIISEVTHRQIYHTFYHIYIQNWEKNSQFDHITFKCSLNALKNVRLSLHFKF